MTVIIFALSWYHTRGIDYPNLWQMIKKRAAVPPRKKKVTTELSTMQTEIDNTTIESKHSAFKTKQHPDDKNNLAYVSI